MKSEPNSLRSSMMPSSETLFDRGNEIMSLSQDERNQPVTTRKFSVFPECIQVMLIKKTKTVWLNYDTNTSRGVLFQNVYKLCWLKKTKTLWLNYDTNTIRGEL